MEKKALKDIITEARKNKRLTQEQLAEKLNVSNKTISRWENGGSMPDLDLVPTLLEVLDLKLEDLFGANNFEVKDSTVYDESIISKYKQKIVIAILSLLLVPLIFLLSAYLIQSKLLARISIFIGALIIFSSVVFVIVVSMRLIDFIKHKYKNRKYALVLKKWLGIYSLIIYIICTLLAIIMKDKVLVIFAVSTIYLLFLGLIIYLIIDLRIKINQVKNIVLAGISLILFLSGLITMSIIEVLPYFTLCVLSQIFNFTILFSSNKVNE